MDYDDYTHFSRQTIPAYNLPSSKLQLSRTEVAPGARPVMQEWVTDIRDQCLEAKVPLFFKQWGGVQKKRAGRTLESRTWDEMPKEMSLMKA